MQFLSLSLVRIAFAHSLKYRARSPVPLIPDPSHAYVCNLYRSFVSPISSVTARRTSISTSFQSCLLRAPGLSKIFSSSSLHHSTFLYPSFNPHFGRFFSLLRKGRRGGRGLQAQSARRTLSWACNGGGSSRPVSPPRPTVRQVVARRVECRQQEDERGERVAVQW